VVTSGFGSGIRHSIALVTKPPRQIRQQVSHRAPLLGLTTDGDNHPPYPLQRICCRVCSNGPIILAMARSVILDLDSAGAAPRDHASTCARWEWWPLPPQRNLAHSHCQSNCRRSGLGRQTVKRES